MNFFADKAPPVFYLKTFGCQMNQHDSERIAGMLISLGWRRTEDEEEARLLLLNTCSVRLHAEARVKGKLARYEKIKESRPEVITGVLGCMAQLQGEALWKISPRLNLIIGPGSFSRLPRGLERVGRGEERYISRDFPPGEEFSGLKPIRPRPFQAWITVMRGCDNFCSYCVVPYCRGRETSRSPESIIEEAADLSRRGYKEITLLGQNVNSYRGLDRRGDRVDFPDLLRRIDGLEGLEGLERIRFVTSHPKDISPELIRAVRDLPRVCESLHFPAQSGSNRVLNKMRRGYTREEYLEKARTIKQEISGIALASDFIVGFPGETEDDFFLTLDLMRRVRFDHVYVFAYSPRPRTAAAALPDNLSPEEKSRRLQAVLELQREISLKINQLHRGQEVEILVEGRDRRYPDRGKGRTRTGKIVFFSWQEGLEGRIITVKIERVTPASLYGERQ